MSASRSVKVIAVASGKGGVGKSNVSVNLAAGLAKLGKSVMLMDADLGMANIDILLGVKPKYDLYHVLQGEKALAEIICAGPMGIKIVPASSGVGSMANLSLMEQASLIRAFGDLNDSIDVLVVDTAAGISSSVVSFSKAAHEVVVVVCDEPASLTDAYGLIKVLNTEHGINRFKVLSNMVKDAEQGRKLFGKLAGATDQFLNVSMAYLGAIPMDEKLKEAVREQSAVVERFPYCASSIAFQHLAQKIIDLPASLQTTGFLEFFVERVGNSTAAMAGQLDG